MNARRRGVLLAGVAATAAALPRFALAQHGALPHPRSLAEELARALAARKALVVMASLEGCPYCKLARESYLAPLRAEGQPVVQIEMGQALPLLNLQGRASTHDQVVRALGVRVAPTVLFIGRQGKPAAAPLAGIASPDFYGAYLAERVATANAAVAA
jgi:thioredoxin-related protein